MECLGFERAGMLVRGRVVRKARFGERSLLPVSAAAVVANAVRETLGSLLGAPVELRLLEPVIPSAAGWDAILRDAALFRVRGALGEAAIVLRPSDACALACAAFGEQIGAERALSPIEREVIQRLGRTLTSTLTSVCGAVSSVPSDATVYRTYFELTIERPVGAHIGVALARDPSPEARGAVAIDDLFGVIIPLRARIAGAALTAHQVGSLHPGDVVAFDQFPRTMLSAGARVIARGVPGARDGRYALAIGDCAA